MVKDMAKNHIDITSLRKEAEKSEHKEAFRIIKRTQRYRVGVGTRLESEESSPKFFIEVLVHLCSSNSPVELELVERNLVLLKRLAKRGYFLTCEEGSSVSCELTVSSARLAEECEATNAAIISLLNGMLEDKNQR